MTPTELFGEAVRPAYDLEHQLYQEMTEPVANWLRDNGARPPPQSIIKRIRAIRKRMRDIGMRPTAAGLFMVDELDILTNDHPVELVEYVIVMSREAWLQIQGKLKCRDVFFQ